MSAVLDQLQMTLQSNERVYPPFFVVGAQRSGTTVLRLMLNRHPELAIPFESGFIIPFLQRLPEYGDLNRRENARRLLTDIAGYYLIADWGRWITDFEAILANPIRDYADLVHAIFLTHAQAKGKSRWGDKTPGQETNIDALWHMFPGCRILHLVRDGRGVAQSNKRVSWGIHSLPRAASDWSWKVTLGHKMGALLGPHYHEVRYENLVLQPEAVLREICAFLGVPYEPVMLGYPETAAREMPPGTEQWHSRSVQALNPSLVFAWKRDMSRADQIIFEQIAGDTLDLLGYHRERLPSTLASRMKNLYYATFCRW